MLVGPVHYCFTKENQVQHIQWVASALILGLTCPVAGQNADEITCVVIKDEKIDHPC